MITEKQDRTLAELAAEAERMLDETAKALTDVDRYYRVMYRALEGIMLSMEYGQTRADIAAIMDTLAEISKFIRSKNTNITHCIMGFKKTGMIKAEVMSPIESGKEQSKEILH